MKDSSSRLQEGKGVDEANNFGDLSKFELERRRLNLQLLKRHDSDIAEIVACSSFVSVYVMDTSSQKWVRGDVEGFLHIVRRSTEPKYELIVINQKNPDNLIQNITREWELSGETNFLFYKIPSGNMVSYNDINNTELQNGVRVCCLWFYEVEERKNIENTLKQIVFKLSNIIPILSEGVCSYSQDAGKTILDMLNKKTIKQNNANTEVSIDSEPSPIIDSVQKLLHYKDILGKSNRKMMQSTINSESLINSNSILLSSKDIKSSDSITNNEHLVISDTYEVKNTQYTGHNLNITPDMIRNIILEVLSSSQVCQMIEDRIMALFNKVRGDNINNVQSFQTQKSWSNNKVHSEQKVGGKQSNSHGSNSHSYSTSHL
ncbi:DCP1-like decapping family protein [Cryptosporidium andersoni]|uniref:DCP1-like decapping family protein n=1 Tax=Cryptosporidium andersoni TaxID=117008 RepID=A0A1J4MUQ4_9CRYT|nr:DCP1-like decapping family protein [Cryptosporidium andersoni]